MYTKWLMMYIFLFLLIGARGTYSVGGWYLKDRDANFKVKRAIHIRFRNFATASFQIITISYHFDTWPNVFRNC